MTPQQKLVRLAELARTPGTMLTPEAVAILADVNLPPRELLGLNDPEAWAKAMSATFAGLSQESALAWMLEAMGAALHAGRLGGELLERERAGQEREVIVGSLVGALALVLDMIDRRQIRPPMVRDDADADNQPRPLREYLADVLRAAGAEVE